VSLVSVLGALLAPFLMQLRSSLPRSLLLLDVRVPVSYVPGEQLEVFFSFFLQLPVL